MKLSRILSNQADLSRQQANQLIASGRVRVDGGVCRTAATEVSRFQAVTVDDRILQPPQPAHYLMLNKPGGYLSATRDDVHATVMDLVPREFGEDLHIAGRLDRASTGLLILTNDGHWSRRLTEPVIRVPKVYRVTTAAPIAGHTAQRFAEGIWFAYEKLTTSPAILEQLGACEARVTIFEGRYHQVKRMFHGVGNRVTSLHRERIGEIALPVDLAPGDCRALTAREIQWVPAA
ncbi:16S rRNA pseudouridine516 synthase [Marinobacter daqiaonensis]|uniref:Pseudouridine synthase n=1 Tax=Marinobacter daqiaonensis TaxID=650891 RepID=A0A1I6HGT3_9GAMM|nr:pseudouridine synthase [Marinobacter daqiaonensis]SFR53578.1 16S rRNA pseudouridine516 synthase [Marinobacter daqiaonensis]